MKKKSGFIIGGIAAVGILGFGMFYSSASKAAPTMTTEEITKKVTAQYPGEITEIEKETEFNRVVYEVEIVNDEKEYDIKLDGNTGEVLEVKEKSIKQSSKVVQENAAKKEATPDSDKIVVKEKKHNQSTAQKKNDQLNQTVISVEEAKKIALDAFPGRIEDIDLDTENGILIYEVEVEQGEREAEIEIDAYTGEIIVIEIDED